MNVAIVFQHWHLLLTGTLTTIGLMLVVGTVAPLLSIPLALARLSRRRWLSWPVAVLSWFTRAVPTLVLLFFAYYGLPVFGIYLNPIPSALAALIFSALGYNIEFFRAGFRAVPKGQYEAARALGMSRWAMLKRIVFPQALRVATPSLFSNLTLNLKGTALASLVSVAELSSNAQALLSDTYRPVEFLVAAAVIYLLLNSALIWLQRRVERHLDPAARKARSSKPAVIKPKACNAATR